MSNKNPILSLSFDEVARFAGMEVYLRGIGADGRYNYTVHDAHCIAVILDRAGDAADNEMLKRLTPSRTATELLYAFRRHQQHVATICLKCGRAKTTCKCEPKLIEA